MNNINYVQGFIIVIVLVVALLYAIPETQFIDISYDGYIYNTDGKVITAQTINMLGKKTTKLLCIREIYFDLIFRNSKLSYQEGLTFKSNSEIDSRQYIFIPNTMQTRGFRDMYPLATHLLISMDMDKLIMYFTLDNNKKYIFISGERENIDRKTISKYVGL